MITDDEVRGPGMAATTGMNVRERMIGYRGERRRAMVVRRLLFANYFPVSTLTDPLDLPRKTYSSLRLRYWSELVSVSRHSPLFSSLSGTA